VQAHIPHLEKKGIFAPDYGRILFYTILLGLAARIVFFSLLRQYPLLYAPTLDEAYYINLGRTIAGGYLAGEKGFFYMDPLYGYFLGGIFSIFGDNLTIVRLIQIGIDCANILLVFSIAKRVFDRRAGSVAAILYALYPVAFFYTLTILKTTLTVTATLVYIWFLLVSRQREKSRFWLGLGLFSGLITLLRANLLLLPVFSILFYPFMGRASWRKIAVNSGFLVAGFLLALSAFAVRNYVVTGHARFLITQSGRLLYCCNNPENTTGVYNVPAFSRSRPSESETDFHREAEKRAGRRLTPGEVSTFWRNETVRTLISHPGIWYPLIVNKVKWIVADREIPMNQSYISAAGFAGITGLPLPGFALVFGLGVPGLMLGLLRKSESGWLLVPVSAILATMLIFCVSSRFRMPAVPFLMIGCGISASIGADWLKNRRILRLTAILLVAASLFTLSILIPSPASNGFVEVQLSQAYLRLGEFGKAAEIAAKGRKKYPDNIKFYILLGQVAASEKRFAEARYFYQKALDTDPGNSLVWYNLGMLYLGHGMPDKAGRFFKKSLAVHRDQKAVLNLGRALEASGDMASAISWYNEYIRKALPTDRERNRLIRRIGEMGERMEKGK